MHIRTWKEFRQRVEEFLDSEGLDEYVALYELRTEWTQSDVYFTVMRNWDTSKGFPNPWLIIH